MKYGWAVLLVLVGVMGPGVARGQVSVYGDFSGSRFTNLLKTNYYYGGTGGLLYEGPKILGHVTVEADIQGRFVRQNGNYLNGLTVGPRFEVPVAYGLKPYAEFMVGFARFKDIDPTCTCNTTGTTDATFQVNGGLAKRVSSHFDATAEFSYAQYFAFGGQFNPKTVSVGAVYHFKGRYVETPHRVAYTPPLPGDTATLPK